MGPLSVNPDDPFPDESIYNSMYAGYTPIQLAVVKFRNMNIIRLLAPFSKNPNAPYSKDFPAMGISKFWNFGSGSKIAFVGPIFQTEVFGQELSKHDIV